MAAPSTSELLAGWERALAVLPSQRGVALLPLVTPAGSAEEVWDLSVGGRDARLLDLREAVFGSAVVAQDACPGCAQDIELDFDLRDIRVGAAPEGLTPRTVALDSYEATVRPPTVLEVIASARDTDLDATTAALLEHAVIAARHDGVPVSAAELPPDLVALIDVELAAMDPQADVGLDVVCPNCGRTWEALFDIAGFLWTELEAWAGRLLTDVHVLASAYCWSESDVLALSPVRRRFYLEAVGA
jgi:hypothetical protein